MQDPRLIVHRMVYHPMAMSLGGCKSHSNASYPHRIHIDKLAESGMTSQCKILIKCLLKYAGISDVDIDDIIAHHIIMLT